MDLLPAIGCGLLLFANAVAHWLQFQELQCDLDSSQSDKIGWNYKLCHRQRCNLWFDCSVDWYAMATMVGLVLSVARRNSAGEWLQADQSNDSGSGCSIGATLCVPSLWLVNRIAFVVEKEAFDKEKKTRYSLQRHSFILYKSVVGLLIKVSQK